MEEHPLLNSVVLQKVFAYLKPTSTLKTVKVLRQVCSAWRDESLDWWRKEAVLKLDPEERNGVTDEIQLLELLQDPDLFFRLEDKPFENLQLENVRINLPNAFVEGTETNVLWKLVGPPVKLLKLKKVQFETGGNSVAHVLKLEHAPMHFLMKHFPGLKSLDAEAIMLDGEAIKRSAGDTGFLELRLPTLISLKLTKCDYFCFQNLPNLQNLGLDNLLGCIAEMAEGIPKTDDADSTLIPGVKELSLDINLESSCEPQSIAVLRKLRFPDLRRLKLSFLRRNNRDYYFWAVRILIRNHSKQLEVLEVFLPPFVGPVNFIPIEYELSNLKELRVWGDAMQDMDFLMWTPRLKVLHLEMRCMEKMKQVQKPQEWRWKSIGDGGGRVVCAPYKCRFSLNNLEFLQVDGVKLEDLKLLSWVMMKPKLKTLRVDLIPGSISAICQSWPDLEHLDGLPGSDLSDDDITGKPGTTGLSGFKHLKSFQYKLLCDKSQLTDAVVSEIMKMDQLRDLQICVSKKFTPEAEQSLKDWMGAKGFVRIIRNYTGNEEHSGWQCCEENEFLQFLAQGDQANYTE